MDTFSFDTANPELTRAFPMFDAAVLSSLEEGSAVVGDEMDQQPISAHDDDVFINEDDEAVTLGAAVPLDEDGDVYRGADGLDDELEHEDGFIIDDDEVLADAASSEQPWAARSRVEPESNSGVPVLPADGACLRSTSARSSLAADALFSAVKAVAARLGCVVAPTGEKSATLLATATDPATGAPVDVSVQVFLQDGADDRVIELQHAGRGQREAFAAVYANIMDSLSAEGICARVRGGQASAADFAAAASTDDAGTTDQLSAPPALSASGRASTVGGASAGSCSVGDGPLLAFSLQSSSSSSSTLSGVSLGSADELPGEEGLRIVSSRLRSSSSSSSSHEEAEASEQPAAAMDAEAAVDAAEAAAAACARLALYSTEERRQECCRRMDAAALPSAVVATVEAAASTPAPPPSSSSEHQQQQRKRASRSSVDDATAVPTLTALARLLACPGTGCSTLASEEGLRRAVAAIAGAAIVAAATLQTVAVTASTTDTASSSSTTTPQAAALLAAYGDDRAIAGSDSSSWQPFGSDGPAATSTAWLQASGAVLRLRAAAQGLLAASKRAGGAEIVSDEAADALAAIQTAAQLARDAPLSSAASTLTAAVLV